MKLSPTICLIISRLSDKIEADIRMQDMHKGHSVRSHKLTEGERTQKVLQFSHSSEEVSMMVFL